MQEREQIEEPTAKATRLSEGRQRPRNQATRVRVLCVDDHAMLVEGLRAQFGLDGGVDVVGSLPTAENLLEEVERASPDVVILDIEMPGPDAFEMADRLHHANPGLPIVFLSAHVRDGYLSAAYKCGASGYFAKGDEIDEIVRGVKEAAKSRTGTFTMGSKVRERCVPTQRGSRRRAGDDEEQLAKTQLELLTPRETEVLRLIGRGMSRGEIASELSRSPKTIDGHQGRIMKKLRIDARSDLMRYAIREGLAEA